MLNFKNEPFLFFDKTQNQLQAKIDKVIQKYRQALPRASASLLPQLGNQDSHKTAQFAAEPAQQSFSFRHSQEKQKEEAPRD